MLTKNKTTLFQDYNAYQVEDHEVWQLLFKEQKANLKDKACIEYIQALDEMQEVLHADRIAKFTSLNQWFSSRTQWEIVRVPGLIPVDEFFELLANKKFCSSTWLRSKQQLEYLEEPDMFHDIFGHVPLLSNETYAEFVHEFGKIGYSLRYNERKVLMLQRLYWYTIEFGLIQQKGLKIYGAGILSSKGESNISIQPEEKTHIPYQIETVLEKTFFTDRIQNEYFVINNFDELYNSLSYIYKNLI